MLLTSMCMQSHDFLGVAAVELEPTAAAQPEGQTSASDDSSWSSSHKPAEQRR